MTNYKRSSDVQSTYKVIGYVGKIGTLEMQTDEKELSIKEFKCFKWDLEENIEEESPRYDYVELLENDKMIDCCFKVEICDACGFGDKSYCISNGCYYCEKMTM